MLRILRNTRFRGPLHQSARDQLGKSRALTGRESNGRSSAARDSKQDRPRWRKRCVLLSESKQSARYRVPVLRLELCITLHRNGQVEFDELTKKDCHSPIKDSQPQKSVVQTCQSSSRFERCRLATSPLISFIATPKTFAVAGASTPGPFVFIEDPTPR